METIKNSKLERVLGMYTDLVNGCVVNKTKMAQRYGVDERSIQRDIDDIRNFLELDAENTGYINTVTYDRAEKGYKLDQIYKMKLSNSEVLALCKILLDSRAFRKDEMTDMLDRLISCCVPLSNQKLVKDLVINEAFHYVEPQHKTRFLDNMWNIGQAIRDCHYIEIEYNAAFVLITFSCAFSICSPSVSATAFLPLAMLFCLLQNLTYLRSVMLD
ncbi:MAG: hypothetical protein HFH84_10110 [Lachnospiraceae bacterium]|nr:hypothetical protein [Lachnospiraceae bacterium]